MIHQLKKKLNSNNDSIKRGFVQGQNFYNLVN